MLQIRVVVHVYSPRPETNVTIEPKKIILLKHNNISKKMYLRVSRVSLTPDSEEDTFSCSVPSAIFPRGEFCNRVLSNIAAIFSQRAEVLLALICILHRVAFLQQIINDKYR